MPDPDIRSQALSMLAKRALTRKELRDRLRRKKFPLAEVNQIVAEFHDKGYIDEQAIIEDAARLGKELKLQGRFLLRYELRRRGLPEAAVNAVLDQDYQPTEEYAVARTFAEHHAAKMTETDSAKKLNRLGAALQRRGFDVEVIQQVLDELE